METRTGFCHAPDGVRLCYGVLGSGPVLVKAANWLSHIEMDWQSPVWRHWWLALSQRHTLVRYDQRGCGLSDWTVEDFSFEARVHDLECVVEAVGAQRFALMGMSVQGGSVAIEYAARHPERVERLVLVGPAARSPARRGQNAGAEREARLLLMREGWGRDNPAYRQMFTSLFVPGASEEQARWFNDLQRISTSPENAVALSSATTQMDVMDRLPAVSAPTIVFHSRGDAVVPFEEGRIVAASIPSARFVPLESRNHILLEDEHAWPTFLAEVEAFLGVDGASVLSPPGVTGGPVPSLRIDAKTVQVWIDERPAHLTRKEYLAVSLLHEAKGALVSKEEIARAVWPEYAGQVADENIEQIISRLRRKLGDTPSAPSPLLTVRGFGYRLRNS